MNDKEIRKRIMHRLFQCGATTLDVLVDVTTVGRKDTKRMLKKMFMEGALQYSPTTKTWNINCPADAFGDDTAFIPGATDKRYRDINALYDDADDSEVILSRH